MDSSHFTRSKARRPSVSLDTPSDVEPDVAPEMAESGSVGFQVKVARGLESLPQEPAVPSSAPAPAEGGSGQGSCGFLLAVVSLGATGDRLDPASPHQEGQMSYTQDMELPPHHVATTTKPLSDSGVPGRPPPVAAAVGERPTSSAARRPSTPRPPATSRNLTIV